MKTLNNFISEALIKKDSKILINDDETLNDILDFFTIDKSYNDFNTIKKSINRWIHEYYVNKVKFYLPKESMLNVYDTVFSQSHSQYIQDKIKINKLKYNSIKDDFNKSKKPYFNFAGSIKLEGNEKYLAIIMTGDSWLIVEND